MGGAYSGDVSTSGLYVVDVGVLHLVGRLDPFLSKYRSILSTEACMYLDDPNAHAILLLSRVTLRSLPPR